MYIYDFKEHKSLTVFFYLVLPSTFRHCMQWRTRIHIS